MQFFKTYILKSLVVIFLAMLVLPSLSFAEDSRYSSLVIDANTGAVLHQENAGKLRYPASLTKMMTLYLTFQALERGTITMNKQLRVSAHAASQKPSVIGFRPGQTISVQDVINAVIIKSANDAAVILAEGIGGTEGQFANTMTRTAKSLGMNHTNFANASGLPNDRQVTTAYDLARLALALRRDFPKYYPMFARASFTYNGRTYFSHNRVTKSYRGADGLKTGYIRASGFNLVTSAHRGGTSLVGVVMGGRSIRSRDTNMVKLLDQAFYKMARSGTGGMQVLNTSAVKTVRKEKEEEGASAGTEEDDKDDDVDDDSSDSANAAEIPTPMLKNMSVKNTSLIVKEKAKEASATRDKATFSRDVAVSNEIIVPSEAPKVRRVIFSPGVNMASYAQTPSSPPALESTPILDDIRPVRVRINGRSVPQPMLRPAEQEKGLVNTNLSPSGSNKRPDMHFANAE